MPNCLKHKLPTLLVLLLGLTLQTVAAEDFSAVVEKVDITLPDEHYELNATLRYRLSPSAKEALQKGIPLSWQLYIKVQQPGVFWNTTVKVLTFKQQIRNHALLNLYSVETSPNRSKNMFLSLAAALDFMSKIHRLRLLDKRLLATDQPYIVAIKTQFNREALPAPLRPASYFNQQWALSSAWSLWQLPN